MRTKVFFIVALFFVMLSSCKKDKTCDSIKSSPQEALDYWFFGEDSYWVYQKKGTEELDTLKTTLHKKEYLEAHEVDDQRVN